MIEIVPATHEAVDYIANRLREADIAELNASRIDASPYDIVLESVELSDWCNVVLIDGIPSIVFGVCPSAEKDSGVPWLLGTDDMDKIKRHLLIGCSSFIEKMLSKYSFLYNIVHCDNAKAIRWLEWLGFHVEKEFIGPLNQFHFFWMNKHV